MDRKLNGSYYTPETISSFLVDYVNAKLKRKSNISVLEPSAGDGSFVNHILKHPIISKINKIHAVEKNKKELNKIKSDDDRYTGFRCDFLTFQKGNDEKYSLVIGNPPYIRKNLLSKTQIENCKKIHEIAGLAKIEPNNIWTAFLVRCIRFVEDNGILAFVLPTELLQVKFASELRTLLLNEFDRIEIFTFNELLFKDCKGQDTIILIGEKTSENKGVYYCNIDKAKDLKASSFELHQNINIKDSKWTHDHITNDEYELIDKLKKKLRVVDDYCSSKAGIVTAANDFFIVNEELVKDYSLQEFVKPIIQKGAFVNGGIEFSTKDFQNLVQKSKPSFLLSLNKDSEFEKTHDVNKYLRLGRKAKLHTRYKMKERDVWYEVPNIGNEPEGFFFKRCHEYPKLIKNKANVLATDSAYKITMKEKYKIEDLIFSFYNSITLICAELDGRYYGGGVLELTPNEFKKLPVPFVYIGGAGNFKKFASEFKSKTSINDILAKNDEIILKSVDLSLDSDNLTMLNTIREKLYQRRIKSH